MRTRRLAGNYSYMTTDDNHSNNSLVVANTTRSYSKTALLLLLHRLVTFSTAISHKMKIESTLALIAVLASTVDAKSLRVRSCFRWGAGVFRSWEVVPS